MYEQIFEEIVNIIHHDYAGCEDKPKTLIWNMQFESLHQESFTS